MSNTKKIDSKSEYACHNGLNIFTVPPTNVSINKSTVREILPLNSVEDSPYEFRVFSDNQWLDLAYTKLYIQCQIQKRDGVGWVPLTAQDTLVAPIQMLDHSFIRQLKMSINGTEVYDSSTLYPYICYIKNELIYSSNVKDTTLAAGGYYRDEAMDNAASAGFLRRNRLMGQSEIVELESRLDFDLATQNLQNQNNLDAHFTVYRHDDNFLIQSLRQGDTNTYRLKVHNIRLRVKTVDVNTAVNLAVGNTLEKTMAKYPVRKAVIRSCYLTPGRTEFVHSVFSHTRPRRIIGAMVNNNAYNGRLTLSPFKFTPFDVRTFEVNVGGEIFPSFSYNMR